MEGTETFVAFSLPQKSCPSSEMLNPGGMGPVYMAEELLEGRQKKKWFTSCPHLTATAQSSRLLVNMDPMILEIKFPGVTGELLDGAIILQKSSSASVFLWSNAGFK